MKAKELIQRIFEAECDFAPAESVDVARSAFLANLTSVLKIELPDGCFEDFSLGARMMFYAGVITGFSAEIQEDAIREAHLAMSFPMTRAIVSRLLRGPGQVTPQGVPVDYGV